MDTIAATEFLPLVATAGVAADSVVVSLHDVAPCTQQITRTIISELGAHGVRVCSVLVVQDYHHEGLFARHREFVAWLRALEADAGGHLGYVRVVGRRRAEAQLPEPIVSVPAQYVRKVLLRSAE